MKEKGRVVRRLGRRGSGFSLRTPLVAILSVLVLGGCTIYKGGSPLLGAEPPECRNSQAVTDQMRGEKEGIRGGSGGHIVPVRWVVPESKTERRKLDDWCRSVGQAIWQMPDAASAVPGEQVVLDSIAVVSWNVFMGGGDLSSFVGDLRSGVWSDGKPVEHFVLLLQEGFREIPPESDALRVMKVSQIVDLSHSIPRRIVEHTSSGERIDVLSAAEEFGLYAYYVPSMRNGMPEGGAEVRWGEGDAEDKGNAILSTLPLDDLTAIELPFEAHRRVAQAAAVDGVGRDGAPWRVRFVNAHLATRSTGLRIWASLGEGRERQARYLVQALEETNFPEDTKAIVLLAGDLNTWSIGSLEGALQVLRSYHTESPVAPEVATLDAGWGWKRRIDYMFLRHPEGERALVYRRIPRRYGSDHHPLLGWLKF